MKKIINDRLLKLSGHLLNTDNILDIGCDHALLEIYLCLKYPNFYITGSDINQKPLKIAMKNISKYHLENQIKLLLSNGIEKLDNNIDTLVISGMGAINMINILQDVRNYPNIKKIVLSPNNVFPYLRYEMNKLGFMIVKEEIVKDNNKYYLIIEYSKGLEKIDNYFGKLDLNNSINREYYLNILEKNKKLLNKITDINKRDLLEKENMMIIHKLER